MAREPETDFSTLEQPFPLKRLFRRRFVPVLLAFVALSLILIGFTAGQVVESIYLELAQRRAQTIARAVDHHEPKAWHALMTEQTVRGPGDSAEGAALNKAFADEVRELNLSELKVYNLQRVVLFATHTEEIGSTENGQALRTVIETHEPGLVTKTLADDSRQYELYVPVFDKKNKLRAVFELYEPVGYLDALLMKAAIPTVGTGPG